MKCLLFTILYSVFTLCAMAEGVGKWKVYPAYKDIQAVDSVSQNCIFALSSGNLFRVNEKDWSVQTYDRITGLTDTGISCIAWNRQARQLVIIYDNANIDLMTMDGDVVNVPDLYQKSTALDKSINGIDIHDRFAFISTGFGIVKLNVKEGLISDSYTLNKSILRISVKDNYIYAKTKDGTILRASQNSNLVDRSQWQTYSGSAEGLFPEKSMDKALAERMKKMLPDGPRQALFGNFKVKNGRLYAVLGNGWDNTIGDLPHIYDIKEDKWTILSDDNGEIAKKAEMPYYHNFMAIDVDPRNDNRVLCSAHGGIYEFLNGQFIGFYGMKNTPMTSAVAGDAYYVVPSAMCFSSNGVLWTFCSQATGKQGLFSHSLNKEWKGYDNSDWVYNNVSLAQAKNMFCDSKGRIWWTNNHWWKPSLNCYDPASGNKFCYSTFINEDNASLEVNRVHCAAEDREGNIWIGTNVGPLMLEMTNVGNEGQVIWNQVKVPRNDGTNLADYLLSGVDITCMTIDGANRKWFGSDGNGVYVIGSDNITQEHNFTHDNSMLLSNSIMGITIDNASGEVYIGTSKGLCSYRSDATEPVVTMDEDNVYAYPNPVTPDYHGPVTITGLSYDADVKITTINGALVAKGRSNGGSFTWDACDLSGRRVASGVYMVLVATAEGEKGVVSRITVVN